MPVPSASADSDAVGAVATVPFDIGADDATELYRALIASAVFVPDSVAKANPVALYIPVRRYRIPVDAAGASVEGTRDGVRYSGKLVFYHDEIVGIGAFNASRRLPSRLVEDAMPPFATARPTDPLLVSGSYIDCDPDDAGAHAEEAANLARIALLEAAADDLDGYADADMSVSLGEPGNDVFLVPVWSFPSHADGRRAVGVVGGAGKHRTLRAR